MLTKDRALLSLVEALFRFKWILAITFGFVFIMWLRIPRKSDPTTAKIYESTTEMPKSTIQYEKTFKNGQEILGRNSCPLNGFDAESVIRNNSRTLPYHPWIYDRKTGICMGADAINCLPAFIQQPETRQYVLAEPTKAVHCVVQKSMSRIFKTLAFFLNDPLDFLLSEKDIIADVYDRSRYNGNVWSKTDDWQYVMVIRDPIERKRNSCKRFCNNCGTDIACFLESQFKDGWKVARKEMPMNVQLQHMLPQTWYCDLNRHFHKYKFLRYNSNSAIFFDQQLGPFLKSRNVSDSTLKYIRNRMTTTRTAHSTSGYELKEYIEQKVRKTPYLLEMMVRLFYHDYIAFNIPLPTVEV